MVVAAVATNIPAEGNGMAVAIGYLVIAQGSGAVLLPLGWLIGRDARRNGDNPWVWATLFVLQPVVVGITYLIVRSRRPRPPGSG